MPKVPFSEENIKKCVCTKCPVQGKSQCVKEKMEAMSKMMGDPGNTGMMPKPEAIPGMYCSTGRATCKDTDYAQMCICGSCLVWQENALANGKPMGYFCRDGVSE
jgi:hypothetical protein